MSRPDGGAASGWMSKPAVGHWSHSQVRQPADVNTLVKQGSALLPLVPAQHRSPGHRQDGWVYKSPAQQGYGGRDRV
jgi:hypothetical protein